MAAPTVELEMKYGIQEFYCPACGTFVFNEEGLNDILCPHILFFYDWVGELYLGKPSTAITDTLENISTIYEEAEDWEQALAQIAVILPPNALIISFYERGRGGGHDGSYISIGVRISTVGEGEA